MMDEYGFAGMEMFDTWHVFGDPSLRVLTRCPDQGSIALDQSTYACESVANIEVQDCGLDANSGVVETVTIAIDSDSEPGGEDVLLTETGPGTAVFAGSIQLSSTDAAAILYVAPGDTVTATYIDEDDGMGGSNVQVTDIAIVDCQPPIISDVQTTDIESHSATVTFDTDEPAGGTVRYGPACDSLTEEASEAGKLTSHTVQLTELTSTTTYFYAVESADEAGNQAVDDNGGICYSFVTPETPDYFTEEFASSDNDLDNFTILFTPDAAPHHYAACGHAISQLPTDPAGGTSLNLLDDDSAAITLSGGATVRLYEVTHSTIYVGSNGYVTFGSGDDEYDESLEDHFSLPRIAALFDDLNPTAGGWISWKQLEDRAAVTWQNVPEYNTSNSNTFQIEMFLDGRIAISYLNIAATDGLTGLSLGGGVPFDYAETDLSAIGYCRTPGDFDHDGDVDNDDFNQFELCFTGPDGGPLSEECVLGDFDGDDDIDCEDWEQFQLAWTAPGDPPTLQRCFAECGNGAVEYGELCDTAIPNGQPGACPTDCDNGDPCDIDTLLNPGTCLAHCEFTTVTEPIHGDGCCPEGANAINDNDCLPACGNDVCEDGADVECVSDCQCTHDTDCSDDYVCTFDQCIGSMCSYTPSRYADIDHNDAINIFDLFCILEGFGGDFSTCAFKDMDIQPCAGNETVNVWDLFAVLNAFSGTDPCCDTPP